MYVYSLVSLFWCSLHPLSLVDHGVVIVNMYIEQKNIYRIDIFKLSLQSPYAPLLPAAVGDHLNILTELDNIPGAQKAAASICSCV